LHQQVGAAGEGRVLVADQDGVGRGGARRVLGAVDEPEQVAAVEVAEALHLVDHAHGRPERRDDPAGQLEARVGAAGPDVEEQVAGGGRRAVPLARDLAKGVQPGGARAVEEPVPGRGPDAEHAGQPLLGHPEPDGPDHARGVGQHVVDACLAARFEREREEHGALGQRGENRLGFGHEHLRSLGRLHDRVSGERGRRLGGGTEAARPRRADARGCGQGGSGVTPAGPGRTVTAISIFCRIL
jgi:hypothetical protein